MIGLFRACSSSILSRNRLFVPRSPSSQYIASLETTFQHSGARTVNLELLLTRFQYCSYSSKKSSGGKRKLDPKPVMKDDKEAFFVVRKGDLLGVYKSLSDCQAQVGTSVMTGSLDFDLNLYILFSCMTGLLVVIHRFMSPLSDFFFMLLFLTLLFLSFLPFL